MSTWIKACAADEIDDEDLIRWDYDGQTFALFNTPRGFFATDGLCTHEDQHLEDGIVIGQVIECPLHQGRFDIASGKALSAPVCVDLKTYPVKLEAGCVFVDIG
ncbi:MAG: Rieske 2Fe-2S domain-containing protein [Alphaproteobacteria bacterium]|nr:Rieske 2Fe-2S domain-containing protein [Alphaproteobacteria bacterium]